MDYSRWTNGETGVTYEGYPYYAQQVNFNYYQPVAAHQQPSDQTQVATSADQAQSLVQDLTLRQQAQQSTSVTPTTTVTAESLTLQQQHQLLLQHQQYLQQTQQSLYQIPQFAVEQSQQQTQQTTQTQATQQQTAATPQQNHFQTQATPAKGRSGGRMPRVKDANKPRGRTTAYAYFVQTCREEHKKKHPDESVVFAEFSKKCAERWKTMDDKEKKRFHDMADRDKIRYDQEMEGYIPPKGEGGGRARKRKTKDPNAPKRALSAFFWFCNDERSKVKAINPEYGVGDIAKELGKRWADADPVNKSRYEAMAEKDRARYEKEMEVYRGPKTQGFRPQPGAYVGVNNNTMVAVGADNLSKQQQPDSDEYDDEGDEDE